MVFYVFDCRVNFKWKVGKMSETTGAILFMSAEDASLGKHGNYGDDSGSHYSWDTTVPNFAVPNVGDIALIRSRHRVIGVSLITEIATEPSFKLRARCGKCNSTKLKWSRSRSAFRCNCGEYTTIPNTEFVGELTSYEAKYDVFFTPLPDWEVDRAKFLSETPKSIHSIQKVNARALLEALPAPVARKLGYRKIAGDFVRVDRQVISRTDPHTLPKAEVCELTGIYAPGHIVETQFAIYNFQTASFEFRGTASVLEVVAFSLSKGTATLSLQGNLISIPLSTPDGEVSYEYPVRPVSNEVSMWLTSYSDTK